ncbi:MAG: hypothetical protein IPM69_14915 [Ignavibacteria bacterium]|nr:hypothetical protein [Ignavibacteria bacterium]
MDNTLQVQEITVIPAKKATRISKPFFFLDEENGAYRATVKAYSSEGELVQNLEVRFTQEEYDAWGTDNEYIYSLLIAKLAMIQIKD